MQTIFQPCSPHGLAGFAKTQILELIRVGRLSLFAAPVGPWRDFGKSCPKWHLHNPSHKRTHCKDDVCSVDERAKPFAIRTIRVGWLCFEQSFYHFLVTALLTINERVMSKANSRTSRISKLQKRKGKGKPLGIIASIPGLNTKAKLGAVCMTCSSPTASNSFNSLTYVAIGLSSSNCTPTISISPDKRRRPSAAQKDHG